MRVYVCVCVCFCRRGIIADTHTHTHTHTHTRARTGEQDIAIIEPSQVHYYQPLWTLVGGGIFPGTKSVRREKDVMPKEVTWIQDR